MYTYWEKRSVSIVNNLTAFAVVFCRFSSFFFHRFSMCCSVCSHHIPWQKYSTESVYTCLLRDSLHRLWSVTFAPEHISFFSFSPLFSFWSCVVDLADLWQLLSTIYNSLSYSIVCRCLLNSVWYACVLWCVCGLCKRYIRRWVNGELEHISHLGHGSPAVCLSMTDVPNAYVCGCGLCRRYIRRWVSWKGSVTSATAPVDMSWRWGIRTQAHWWLSRYPNTCLTCRYLELPRWDRIS